MKELAKKLQELTQDAHNMEAANYERIESLTIQLKNVLGQLCGKTPTEEPKYCESKEEIASQMGIYYDMLKNQFSKYQIKLERLIQYDSRYKEIGNRISDYIDESLLCYEKIMNVFEENPNVVTGYMDEYNKTLINLEKSAEILEEINATEVEELDGLLLARANWQMSQGVHTATRTALISLNPDNIEELDATEKKCCENSAIDTYILSQMQIDELQCYMLEAQRSNKIVETESNFIHNVAFAALSNCGYSFATEYFAIGMLQDTVQVINSGIDCNSHEGDSREAKEAYFSLNCAKMMGDISTYLPYFIPFGIEVDAFTRAGKYIIKKYEPTRQELFKGELELYLSEDPRGFAYYIYQYVQKGEMSPEDAVEACRKHYDEKEIGASEEDWNGAVGAREIVYRDPLVLDLNNDKTYSTRLEEGVFFDYAGDGYAEKTGWISKEDGLLARDINQNGTIDNGAELFGDKTVLKDGTVANNGFEALAELDSNQDGVVDANDLEYQDLRVWIDQNSDGVTQEGELKTLAQAGIDHIDIKSTNKNSQDANQNTILNLGQAVKTDESSISVAEMNYKVDFIHTKNLNEMEIAEDFLAQFPRIAGCGTVSSLSQCMFENEDLYNTVQQYMDCTDIGEASLLLERVMLLWTGADTVDASSRGNNINAAHLTALEKFYGREFHGVDGVNPNVTAAALLENMYSDIKSELQCKLLEKTMLKKPISYTRNYEDANGELHYDYTYVAQYFNQIAKSNLEKTLYQIAMYARYMESEKISSPIFDINTFKKVLEKVNPELILGVQMKDSDNWVLASSESKDIKGSQQEDVLYGNAEDNIITGDAGSDILIGDDGNDTLNGQCDNDIIYGGDGNDTIYGGNGNDTMDGGDGNDTLTGGSGDDYMDGGYYGDDTYIFAPGHGKDTIKDQNYLGESDKDKIVFLEGIAPQDIKISFVENNLLLQNKNGEDQITVVDFFSPSYMGYSYGAYTKKSDSENRPNKIESVEFADGTVWDVNYILNEAKATHGTDKDDTITGKSNEENTIHGESSNDTLTGGAKNDRLYGEDGKDILTGKAGDDYLNGGKGNDVYVFEAGHGKDIIHDTDATRGNVDIIRMMEGINSSDISISFAGNDLVLQNKNGVDQITVENFFEPTYVVAGESKPTYDSKNLVNKIERVEFADGTVWNLSYLLEKARNVTGTDQADTLTGNDYLNNVLRGNAGNDTLIGGKLADTLSGGQGDDILHGGSGNDKLYGASGNDTLNGGTGNDTLLGSYGNDTYVFEVGHGKDIIKDVDATKGNVDIIRMMEGIQASEIEILFNNNDLVLRNKNGEDEITVQDFFDPYYLSDGASKPAFDSKNMANKIERVEFADGTVWTIPYLTEKARNVTGTNQADTLIGNDNLNNILRGNAGNDTLIGGKLADTLSGGQGDDILNGGAGNDKLYGASGNDTLNGETGNDTLLGSYGNDMYVFEAGYGKDIIKDVDATKGNVDIIRMMEGIQASEIDILFHNNDLFLRNKNGEDEITVQDFFDPYYLLDGASKPAFDSKNMANKIERVEFADGTVWTIPYLTEKARNVTGTDKDDTLTGNDHLNNVLRGNAGNDTLIGGELADTLSGGQGNDILHGGDGNDKLYGASGNDTMNGGSGDDLLLGSYGNDVYEFEAGHGNDTIKDVDATKGNVDIIRMLEGIDKEDIGLFADNDSLVLANKNGNDSITVEDFFSTSYTPDGAKKELYDSTGMANRIEQVEFYDGTVWDMTTLNKSDVQDISMVDLASTQVDAMAQMLAADTVDQGLLMSENNELETKEEDKLLADLMVVNQ